MVVFPLFLVLANICIFLSASASTIKTEVINNNLFLNVSNFKLQRCVENSSYPVLVSDVDINITNKSEIDFKGTLQTQVDLNEDIQADVILKRDVWGVWIHVPCEHNIGSCTYKDLCTFGVPSDKNCPKDFIQENVPCRCPVVKGIYPYHIKTKPVFHSVLSIYTGSYVGSIRVNYEDNLLSCYNFSFDIVNKSEKMLSLPFVVQIR